MEGACSGTGLTHHYRLDLAFREAVHQRRAAIGVLAVKVKPPSAVASQELREP